MPVVAAPLPELLKHGSPYNDHLSANAASAREITVLRGHDDTVRVRRLQPRWVALATASDDKTARIWDAHFQTMSVKDQLTEVCARLAGVTTLTREEMRLAGYLSGRFPRWQQKQIFQR